MEWKKDTESNTQSYEAHKAHADWVLAGKPVDKIGHPQLNKKDSLVVVKFCLLRVDITGGILNERLQLDELVHCVAGKDCMRNVMGQAHGHGSAKNKRAVRG